MKIKILGIALFVLTLGVVVYYPQLMAKNVPVNPPINHHIIASQNPKIDVVFVLDTTGSMSGLIQTAKERSGQLRQRWRRHSRHLRFALAWLLIETAAIST